MKKILLLATGGTIASKSTKNGLMPMISSEEILGYVPELADAADIDALSLFCIDSTNITCDHWIKIAETVKKEYENYDGFVITHGTDTMAYTAAALSYLIQQSPKPIVLTGSQKSIYLRDTDARNNLIGAVLYACDDMSSGVSVVFDGKVIIGTRAKKTRTKSFNAFSSIDYPELASIRDGRIIRYITERYSGEPVFYEKLDSEIFIYKLIPGADPWILDRLIGRYHAVVIESFGVGGIPCCANSDFIGALRRLGDAGITIVMTTQVSHEGSDMEVYEVGQTAKEELNLMEAYDMTIEAVTAKLMWILGQTNDSDKIRDMFYTPISHDII
jgi:L-asparaginase